MSKATLLIVDDEAAIRRLLSITLTANDYRVVEASTGKEALSLAASIAPDVILLDIGLPDSNGQEVLLRLREWYTRPIIMLSVQNGEEDIVKALDNGANDYLAKPFRTGELLARIRSTLRLPAPDSGSPVIVAGPFLLDITAHSIQKDQHEIKLTPTEYELLALLIKNEGKVLTHHQLLRHVWGNAYSQESQYLRVYMAQLRKKIEADPNRPVHIITESGVGYRFAS